MKKMNTPAGIAPQSGSSQEDCTKQCTDMMKAGFECKHASYTEEDKLCYFFGSGNKIKTDDTGEKKKSKGSKGKKKSKDKKKSK